MLKSVSHLSSSPPIDESARSEDVRFSPSGRLLAVPTTCGSLLLFAVDVGARPVRIERRTVLRSIDLANPHGVEFLREHVIAVANRTGCVTFHRIPPAANWAQESADVAVHRMDSTWFGRPGAQRALRRRRLSCGPGSIRAHGGALYVCCNNENTVTRHPYRIRDGSIETGEGVVVARHGLEVPDGLAFSRDGRWMAISDHDHHRVVVARVENAASACELRDADLRYPHGLCFDPSGHLLYVADAGTRDLHVFHAPGGWDGSAHGSAFRLSAVDADAFRLAREDVAEEHRPLEGGIKGIDVDPSGRIVATTCRHQTLRFFETQPIASTSA